MQGYTFFKSMSFFTNVCVSHLIQRLTHIELHSILDITIIIIY